MARRPDRRRVDVGGQRGTHVLGAGRLAVIGLVPFFLRLDHRALHGQAAEQALGAREGEHVGVLVQAPVRLVELPHQLVVGYDDANAGVIFGRTRSQRGGDGVVGRAYASPAATT